MSVTADPDIVVGEDGFQFHRRDRGFEQFCGDPPVDFAVDIRRWAVALESRHAWCRMQGAAYLTLIIPARHVVYADKLPPGVALQPDRLVRRLREALHPTVQTDFIYPEQAMRAGRAEHAVFPRAEGPWTPFGAWLGYRALAEAMARHAAIEPIREDELRWPEGDAEENAPVTVTRGPRARRIFREQSVQVFAGGGAGLPRLVLFGEPIPARLVDPFLLAHVSRLVILSGRAFINELVRAEKPDFVVSMLPEHYLGAPEGFVNELERVTFAAVTGGLSLPLPVE